MSDAYERLIERAREASRRLSAELEEMNEPPAADDRRHLVIKSRLADVMRSTRKLVLFNKAVAASRGSWRKKVAAAEVNDDFDAVVNDESFEFEPPY